MTNTFITQTDSQYVRRQSVFAVLPVFLVFSLVACCVCFFVGWELLLFFELVIIIASVHTLFQNMKKEHLWKLEFERDQLTVTNLKTGESYQVYDTPASDFIITQTKGELSLDYCSVTIKDTIFAFGGVQNCQQLKAYIQENYQ